MEIDGVLPRKAVGGGPIKNHFLHRPSMEGRRAFHQCGRTPIPCEFSSCLSTGEGLQDGSVCFATGRPDSTRYFRYTRFHGLGRSTGRRFILASMSLRASHSIMPPSFSNTYSKQPTYHACIQYTAEKIEGSSTTVEKPLRTLWHFRRKPTCFFKDYFLLHNLRSVC